MDVDRYLERIGLTQAPPATAAGLAALQWAHQTHVPFENLDVFLQRPLDLEPAALFEKIVLARRGGYCFELNTLFAELLRALGFQPSPHLARVWLRIADGTPARNHLAHSVVVDGRRWLTDVGFGGRAMRCPLVIDDPSPVDDGDGDGPVRIEPSAEFGYMIERFAEGAWQAQYSVDLGPAYPRDILVANHFTATNPASHFTQGRFVGMFTAAGRNGLVDRQLTLRDGPELVHHDVEDGDAWLDCIERHFGLRLDLSTDEYRRLTA